MTMYEKAAANMTEYCEKQMKLYERGLKSAGDVWQNTSGYLSAMVDSGLCGAGYANNIRDEISKKLY